jgi:hypothetical protein
LVFEGVYSLSVVLSRPLLKVSFNAAFEFWQRYRMERVERVLDLTKKLNAKGMLAEELAWLGRAATFGENGWEQREWF